MVKERYWRHPLLRAAILGLVLLIVAGCGTLSTSSTGLATCLESLRKPTSITIVHIQPDAGTSPVLEEIRNAECTIDISMYLFTEDTIIAELGNAVKRGVRVRVILEKNPFSVYGTPQSSFDQIAATGAEVKWASEQFEYSHAKYMVIDARVALITNQNFTNAGFTRNREFGVVTTDPEVVAEAQMIFDADWNNERSDLPESVLVISPDNSRARITSLVDSANESIWLYSEVFRDDGIAAALNAAADRGVDVRVLVNESADEADIPYFLTILDHGVNVRVLEKPYVHSKVMIIDGSKVLIGSQNYTYTSLNLNREVGLVVDDPVETSRVVDVYEGDWSRGIPVETIIRDER